MMISSEQSEWLASYEVIARENASRVAFFADLYREATQAGIRLVPLKGVDFMLRGVRPMGLKPMSDVDVLVDARHLRQWIEWLLRKGFTPKPALSPWKESLVEPCADYVSPDREHLLDFVWSFEYGAAMPEVWDRTAPRQTFIGPVTMLHPQDVLEYTLQYAARRPSRWTGRLLTDLETLIDKEKDLLDVDGWRRRVRHWAVSQYRVTRPARQSVKSVIWPNRDLVLARYGKPWSWADYAKRVAGKPIHWAWRKAAPHTSNPTRQTSKVSPS